MQMAITFQLRFRPARSRKVHTFWKSNPIAAIRMHIIFLLRHSRTQLKSPGGLSPGLYCVTGSMRLNAHDDARGSGVTIVMLDGDIDINGNSEVNLSAPSSTPDPSPAIPNLLFYAPPSNHTRWIINGNEESYFVGTILAPGATVEFKGTGNTEAYHSQIIAWDVEMGGNAKLDVVYDANQQASRPTALDLYR